MLGAGGADARGYAVGETTRVSASCSTGKFTEAAMKHF
jgi:hypothetical protein